MRLLRRGGRKLIMTPDGAAARTEAAAESGGERILLVEDDASVRALASRVLRRRGYRVIEARDGVQALGLFRADPSAVDMVLSDVVMPELGGRELVERVLAERPGLPVLLMSGYTDDVILRHGARGLGAGFLEKPFTPNGLVERVREVLEGRGGGTGTGTAAEPRDGPGPGEDL